MIQIRGIIQYSPDSLVAATAVKICETYSNHSSPVLCIPAHDTKGPKINSRSHLGFFLLDHRWMRNVQHAATLDAQSKTRPSSSLKSFYLKSQHRRRPPGGVEEMQGGGRRVRLESGAYITV
ncbi:hypothetical protein FHG87_022496 [Trinorchestia longiramus]|nr:hypothetical protein FHG87_022496 [Trinorchestia longiramus]